MRTALIDGDSIAYILGWKFKDSDDENLMQYSVDNFVKSTLILLEASHYIGALSSKPVFRDQVYKFAKYKGTRGEDQPGIARWKPFINVHLRTQWGFVSLPNLEADDIVGYHAFNEKLGHRVVCSPDKDLRQIAGDLYNYSTGIREMISEVEARTNFHMQMLCGDSTDNIKGIPGYGPAKAEKKLSEGDKVYDLFINYFGNYYGPIIYEETLATVMVLQPGHTYESYFDQSLKLIEPIACNFDQDAVMLSDMDFD
jgi:5'-3' exonuclease, N-terminal resolvase-like domain